MEEEKKSWKAWFKQEKLLKSKNIVLSLILIVFILGNTFFFSSNFILKDTTDYPTTALDTAQFLYGTHQITIRRWEYSPAENKMEVELDIENTTNDGYDVYKFAAVSMPESKLQVTPVVQEMNYAVVQIENVPKKFKAISFRVMIDDPAFTDQLKLYTNAGTAVTVDALPLKSREDYYVQRIRRNITAYTAKIDDEKKKIESYQGQITNLKNNNQKLVEDEKYLTVDEIEKNNVLIKNNQNRITEIEKLMKESQTLVKQTEAKIAQANERLQALT